eukprot:CAMPEP_0168270852 /NCGR_PEP_ID=MMETSP0141_2-20121125/15239_1 /TAXON_ID=44445 /ORGANISM="Pseudo-nitzschia australis, Strain 10249 10 AB" /LENGTH=59 /DNA_ID=CAMNT_0008211907 /DNA_START=37 /DNA_END=216 /DNA_ORIENTATION=-
MTFVGPVKGHFDSDVLEAPEMGHLDSVIAIVVFEYGAQENKANRTSYGGNRGGKIIVRK